jgi:hypothetical protein
MPSGGRFWFRLAYLLWILGVVGYFIPPVTWSPVSRFAVTSSIVERGELDIDPLADATGDRAPYGGHWYSDKPPVPALLAVPAYALFHLGDRLRGRSPSFVALASGNTPAIRVLPNRSMQRGLYTCSLATAGLSGALIAVLLFELLVHRFSPLVALYASSTAVLGSPILPYATSFYGHAVAAAFLTAALAAFAMDPSTREGPTSKNSRIAGACLVGAIGSEYITLGPALAMVLTVLASIPAQSRARVMYDLTLGGLVPAVLIGSYHSLCFGAPWRLGYSFVTRSEFAAGHATGLLGINPPRLEVIGELLFGRRRGLWYVAPVSLVGVVGLGVLALRTRDLAARAGALGFATLLLLNAGYYMWWGGAAAAPRHLIPALGALALGVAASTKLGWARAIVIPLALLSVVNMLAICAVGIEAPETGDVLFGYVYPRVLSGEIATMSGSSNLGILLGLPRPLSLIPLLLWIVGGLTYLTMRLRSEAASAPAVTKAEAV